MALQQAFAEALQRAVDEGVKSITDAVLEAARSPENVRQSNQMMAGVAKKADGMARAYAAHDCEDCKERDYCADADMLVELIGMDQPDALRLLIVLLSARARELAQADAARAMERHGRLSNTEACA